MSFLNRSSRYLASTALRSVSSRAQPAVVSCAPILKSSVGHGPSPVLMASRAMASKGKNFEKKVPVSTISFISLLPCFPADTDLVTFLTEEIAAEKQNSRPIPDVPGFKVEQDGADLKMTKDLKGEKVVIQLNVNHTVDSAEPDDGTEEAPEMKSKPNFEIDLVKGSKTVSFSCSFIPEDQDNPPQAEDEQGNKRL